MGTSRVDAFSSPTRRRHSCATRRPTHFLDEFQTQSREAAQISSQRFAIVLTSVAAGEQLDVGVDPAWRGGQLDSVGVGTSCPLCRGAERTTARRASAALPIAFSIDIVSCERCNDTISNN